MTSIDNIASIKRKSINLMIGDRHSKCSNAIRQIYSFVLVLNGWQFTDCSINDWLTVQRSLAFRFLDLEPQTLPRYDVHLSSDRRIYDANDRIVNDDDAN